MEAMITHNIEKPISWNWPVANGQLLSCFRHILLRDIIPTLAITAVVAWGALLVTEQIHQAKLSRTSDTVVIFQEKGSPIGNSLPIAEHADHYEEE